VIQRLSRRTFVYTLSVLLAGAAIGSKSPSLYAQQPARPRRIGVLLVAHALDSKVAQSIRQGLGDAGYSEERDVTIEWRSAGGDYVRLPELVADLIQREVDVIIVDSTPGTQAVKRATSTIPIVMCLVGDPVGSGLVANLAHPGGNVTGLTIMASALAAKRLQLLKEAIPQLARLAVLWNPDTPTHPKVIESLKASAPSLSIELKLVGVRTPEETRSRIFGYQPSACTIRFCNR
jgi:putative tryptophan/tyrosine transport system substrate-binding protein